jgi:nucleoside-diphosphate-sugar epimerase
MNFTINGISGWLGQATLGAIKQISPTIKVDNLQMMSSATKHLHTLEFGEVSSKSLKQEANSLEKTDVFVQLAFKTRDYVSKLGPEEYEHANTEIIYNSLKAIRQSNPSHVVMVSSGVVSQWLSDPSSFEKDPYVRMKLIEEQEISKLCAELDANLINLRLWGASGFHMTEPLKYAIGDLIYQDAHSDFLELKSAHQVFRRYADASQQMEICIRAAIAGQNNIIESGGTVLEIEQLANEITKLSGSGKSIRRPKMSNNAADSYFSESNHMEQLASLYGINLYGIETQISLTSQAVSRYLNQLP